VRGWCGHAHRTHVVPRGSRPTRPCPHQVATPVVGSQTARCSAPLPDRSASCGARGGTATMSRRSASPENSRSSETEGLGLASTKRDPLARARSWASWNTRQPARVDGAQVEQVHHEFAGSVVAHDVRQEVAEFEHGAGVEITRHADHNTAAAVPNLERQERIDDVGHQARRRTQVRVLSQGCSALPHLRMLSKQPCNLRPTWRDNRGTASATARSRTFVVYWPTRLVLAQKTNRGRAHFRLGVESRGEAASRKPKASPPSGSPGSAWTRSSTVVGAADAAGPRSDRKGRRRHDRI
jgi:hypothetical protein